MATPTDFQCFSLVGNDVNGFNSTVFQDVSRSRKQFLLLGKESFAKVESKHIDILEDPQWWVDKREAVPLHVGLSQHSPHPD